MRVGSCLPPVGLMHDPLSWTLLSPLPGCSAGRWCCSRLLLLQAVLGLWPQATTACCCCRPWLSLSETLPVCLPFLFRGLNRWDQPPPATLPWPLLLLMGAPSMLCCSSHCEAINCMMGRSIRNDAVVLPPVPAVAWQHALMSKDANSQSTDTTHTKSALHITRVEQVTACLTHNTLDTRM